MRTKDNTYAAGFICVQLNRKVKRGKQSADIRLIKLRSVTKF